MNKLISQLLKQIISNLDSGSSSLEDEDALKVINTLKDFTNNETPISKYQAYNYLGISRATFDNLVKEGKLPKGKKVAGFKELQWSKKELKDYIKNK